MKAAIKTLAVLALAPCSLFDVCAVHPHRPRHQFRRRRTVNDFHLVNGWGLVSTGTSPFWLATNSTAFPLCTPSATRVGWWWNFG